MLDAVGDMCRYDPEAGGAASVVLRSASLGYLSFYNRRRPDHYVIHICVAAAARGMRAELHNVACYDNWHIADFVEGLAADFSGWGGTRSWHSPDHDLAVTAVHTSGGHVRMTWTLRPWRQSATGGWSATIETTVAAGEQMRALAGELYRFLDPDSLPRPADADRYNCGSG